MTRTTRLRRTILHLLHNFLTDAITFIAGLHKNHYPTRAIRPRGLRNVQKKLSTSACFAMLEPSAL